MPGVEVSGAMLDYVEAGAGDAVVFVHGSFSDRRAWTLQLAPFAERYRVVAYSRRHHHGSEDPAMGRPLTAPAAAQDLVDLIEAMGLAPAHVVGSSYGACTAMLAARSRPDVVRTLVLGEPPMGHLLLSDPATKPAWDGIMTGYNAARAHVKAGDDEAALRAFVDVVAGPGALDQMPPPLREVMLQNAATLRIEEAPTMPFEAEDAARITMPVLLVTGAQSMPLFHMITDKLHALLPHAARVDIADAAHGMHAQNPQAYNRAVLEFLARN